MDTPGPAPLLMLGGGVVMFIGSLLKWRFDTSGVSSEWQGVLGILALLFGLLIAGIAGVRVFANSVELPSGTLGISLDKVCVILSASIFLWTFGLIAAEQIKVGINLTWIGAAMATVGGVMAVRDDSSAPASTI